MGQVVVNCEEAMDIIMVEDSENEEMGGGNDDSSPMEKWDPSNPLRVLLVEADDSTRQIVGALLRKCNYKVASVSDGLKAWEVIKARHDNIDIILTEVELPSISGYALLSLISEHEICKNIPVIMMSTQDSVSVVYKCMLRGAADFLVKPIRINELRNLWQHVWRRQSVVNHEGHGPQDESLTHEKLEATATSDNSSSSKSCTPARQDECIKNQDLEPKSAEEIRVSDSKIQENSNWENFSQNLCTPENVILCDSSREAIDLIGNFDDNHARQNPYSNGGNINNFDCSKRLDLSLRRYQSGALEINNTTQEKQIISHSNSSAFTQYVNNTLYSSNSNTKDTDNILEKEVEKHALHRLFPIPSPAMSPRVVSTSPSSQSPCSGNQQINYYHQYTNPNDQNPSKQERQLESSEDGSQFTTTPADQSASSALSNGTATRHFNGSGYGSNSNDAVVPGVSDSGSEPPYRQRSSLREAALNKFRLKRKERCFEKKVRYESRKKLAEQRPRVKGQFVRQNPCEPSSTNRI